MSLLKRILIEAYYSVVFYIPGLFMELLNGWRSKNMIALISYLDVRWGHFHQQNWGDDMNVFLAHLWFNKRVVCYNTSVLSWLTGRKNYALIGSILQSANRNTIVWGSGLLYENDYPREQPQKIYAVRGPLSRAVLMAHGLSCPAVYGDPILLMPQYYRPITTKKYRVGIIAHMNDEADELLKAYQLHHTDIHLISMAHYHRWQDVIDQIVACEYVLSSSLHGLILSDAYGIPNTWIEFHRQERDKAFKFLDYFASVARPTKKPVIIQSISDIEEVLELKQSYRPIAIDLQPLIDSCPFQLPFSKTH